MLRNSCKGYFGPLQYLDRLTELVKLGAAFRATFEMCADFSRYRLAGRAAENSTMRDCSSTHSGLLFMRILLEEEAS
ncbi:MAG TPA: hypothetical protein PLR50_00520 [Candidatus Rifleibacterium sp.]|nr:hypothetical protein [Candidatus Rifleibacterium sp.]